MRPWLAGFTLLAFAVLVALGVWQLQRRAWKLDLLARIEAAERSPPQRLQLLLGRGAEPGALEFRPAFVYCRGVEHARFVELYALVEGRPGWRLISACPLSEGSYDAVLVDRGVAPDAPPGESGARPPVEFSQEVVRVAGVLRAPGERGRFTPEARDGRWFWRDIPSMGAALGVARPAPVMLTSAAALPAGAGLVAAPLPREVSNRHLEYALTWFGLAGALVAVYAALVLKGRSIR